MTFTSQITNYSSNAGESPNILFHPTQLAIKEDRHKRKPYEGKNVIGEKFSIPTSIPIGPFESFTNSDPIKTSKKSPSNILDNTLEKIVKTKFAFISPDNLSLIKNYISKMQATNNYNPINLLLMVEKTNKYLHEVTQYGKEIFTEIEYFLDEEDEKLDGISINIYLPVKDAKEISDIWEYLNENIGSEENGSDRIFFNVRKKR